MDDHLSLRDRKRLQAMRTIQATALDLAEDRSFASISVDEIARATDVSASSIFRYFGTKEGIFLWEEYDQPAIEGFGRNLASMQPLEALQAALHETLASRAAQDEQRLLRQLDVVYREPPLTAAMAHETDRFRHEMAQMLAAAVGRDEPDLEVRVAASAIIGALITAIEEFVRTRGRRPLPDLFDDAVEVLARGVTLTA